MHDRFTLTEIENIKIIHSDGSVDTLHDGKPTTTETSGEAWLHGKMDEHRPLDDLSNLKAFLADINIDVEQLLAKH